tara:strand:- start:2 stop:106 length:105 start_codon:yes stop_codon:yes gene_type:complete
VAAVGVLLAAQEEQVLVLAVLAARELKQTAIVLH